MDPSPNVTGASRLVDITPPPTSGHAGRAQSIEDAELAVRPAARRASTPSASAYDADAPGAARCATPT
jgi:hypothetical protein